MKKSEYNVKGEYQRSLIGAIPVDTDLWENHGFLVRGVAEGGVDLTMWASPYLLKRGTGNEAKSFHLADAAINQLLLLAGRYSDNERNRMNDNDFVAAGWLPSDFLDISALRFEEIADGARWSIGDLVYEDSPPKFSLRGSSRGVDLDLSFEAEVPAFEVHPFSDLARDNAGWYEAYLRASGRITYGGRTLEIDRAWACHERVAMIGTYDIGPQLANPGNRWHHLFGENVQCWFMTTAAAPGGTAYVIVDGSTYIARGSELEVEELDYWLDPRSDFRIPWKWHVRVRHTSGGVLDFVANAFNRGYYPWTGFRNTVNVLYWHSAQATGTFTESNGRIHTFERALVYGALEPHLLQSQRDNPTCWRSVTSYKGSRRN